MWVRLRLLAIPDEEMPLGPAEADTRNNRIKFRQSAYNQLCKGSVWALEVLAHELGHFKLNHDGIRFRKEGLNHSRRSGRDEPQAHLFARALIAPAAIAANFDTAESLATTFNMQ